MLFGDKIKLLRKEKELSQDKLGKLIGGDARQISLYETNKISPSADAVKKLAKTFNVSIDYLLFEEAERKPLLLVKDELLDRLQKIKELEQEDRNSVLKIIDGLITKTRFQNLAAIK